MTILTLTPIWRALAMVALACVARRIEQGQHADKLPFAVPVRPGDAQGTKAACGEFLDGLFDGGLSPAGVGRHRQDHLRRSLGHLECFPSAPLTVASVRLCTGSKGRKWST